METMSKKGEMVPKTSLVKHLSWIHVYEALCKFGLCGPYFVASGISITGKLYSEKILPRMINDLTKKFGNKSFQFQQDGAGAHFAKVTTNFLEKEKVNFIPENCGRETK